MTRDAPTLDMSTRVGLRRMERRQALRGWCQHFLTLTAICLVATLVVPEDPWWARPGFGGVALFCAVWAVAAAWRLRAYEDRRGA